MEVAVAIRCFQKIDKQAAQYKTNTSKDIVSLELHAISFLRFLTQVSTSQRQTQFKRGQKHQKKVLFETQINETKKEEVREGLINKSFIVQQGTFD